MEGVFFNHENLEIIRLLLVFYAIKVALKMLESVEVKRRIRSRRKLLGFRIGRGALEEKMRKFVWFH